MTSRPRPTRAQVVLGSACVASYAVGYPLAILGNAWIGWVLVTVGGLFLFAVLALTVQRINRRP